MPAAASGACRICFAATTAFSRPASATPAATRPMQPIAITEHTQKQSRSSLILRRISYRQILEFFFQIHDPTTRNAQGNDVGTSYRSAIFYTTDEQRRVAEDTIADVDESGLWPGKVVTEVVPVRRLLGSRARAPGLSRAKSRRLHVPFHSARLEAADSQEQGKGRLKARRDASPWVSWRAPEASLGS